MRTGIDQYFTYDFTRFFYHGVAFKRSFKSARPANRDDDVLRWYRFFNDTNEYSDLTKQSYLRDFALFVRHCDYKNLRPESAEAVESLERHLVEQVRIEKMNVNSARKQISCVKKCLEKLGNPSSTWFSSYSLFRSEVNPTEGYSDRELSVLIKIIYRFFNQLSKQILDEPDKYLQATTNKRVGTFIYQGFTHDIASPITKCFSAAYFLLALICSSKTGHFIKRHFVVQS
jgi:mannose/cellobiose epimerase-like protein (N-acyl-D-glucosamine 2-epimerase family)